MPKKWEAIAKALFEAEVFTELSSRVHARALFMCEYCGVSILEQLDSWQGSACDHILPQSKYVKLIKDQNNLALSCKACNDLKRNWDLTESLPDSVMLDWKNLDGLTPIQRREFVQICRNKLTELRKPAIKNIEKVKTILLEQIHTEETCN